MKKIVSLLLIAVMSVAILTGCGNALYDDFENFLNVSMDEVNANYEKITAEAAKWETFETENEIVESINNVLIPLVDDSLEKLGTIAPETEEVKALKDKYVSVMEAYKEGFVNFAKGIAIQDEEIMNAGNEKINEGIELLNEYNTGLEDLAAQVGAEIQY